MWIVSYGFFANFAMIRMEFIGRLGLFQPDPSAKRERLLVYDKRDIPNTNEPGPFIWLVVRISSPIVEV